MLVNFAKLLNGCLTFRRVLSADQYPVRVHQVLYSGALGEKLGIREDLKRKTEGRSEAD